jgi:hypothetical protein
VIGRKVHRSPSIYPDDPESTHYDPMVFINEDQSGHHRKPGRDRESGGRDDGEPGGPDAVLQRGEHDALAFLRRILDEARSKRHDMVTHYTIDHLRVALGFEKPRSEDGGRVLGSASDAPANAPHPHGDS